MAEGHPFRAILWQVASGLLFVGMTAVVKHAGAGMPPVQSAFLRFALGLPLILPLVPAMLRAGPGPARGGFLALRGVLHTAAVVLWFHALVTIPLAEVTAMNYLNPVYVILGAILIIGERADPRRMLAVLVAVIGAAVILRPGFREISSGHLAMLGMTAFMAGGYLVAKRLTASLPASVVVGWLTVAVSLLLAPLAWWVWEPVGLRDLAWFFLSAVFATAAHYSMTRAFAGAPLGVTQPVAFLQLVWSAVLGVVAFAEPVDPLVILGAVIILAAISWSSLPDLRRARPAPLA